jgi:hypothetical protein
MPSHPSMILAQSLPAITVPPFSAVCACCGDPVEAQNPRSWRRVIRGGVAVPFCPACAVARG